MSLAQAAQAQVRNASVGKSLAAISAELHHPELTQPSRTNQEARYKAAYWQAVGSRMLQGRGQSSSTLTMAAAADYAAAWLYRPTAGDQIVPTTTNAIARLREAGLYDVAGALAQTVDQRATKRQEQQALQQANSRGGSLMAAFDFRPAWMKTRGASWAFTGFAVIIGLGLLATVFRWALGPYIGAGRAAYRTVRGRR